MPCWLVHEGGSTAKARKRAHEWRKPRLIMSMMIFKRTFFYIETGRLFWLKFRSVEIVLFKVANSVSSLKQPICGEDSLSRKFMFFDERNGENFQLGHLGQFQNDLRTTYRGAEMSL